MGGNRAPVWRRTREFRGKTDFRHNRRAPEYAQERGRGSVDEIAIKCVAARGCVDRLVPDPSMEMRRRKKMFLLGKKTRQKVALVVSCIYNEIMTGQGAA